MATSKLYIIGGITAAVTLTLVLALCLRGSSVTATGAETDASIMFLGNPLVDIVRNTGLGYVLAKGLAPDHEIFQVDSSSYEQSIRDMIAESATDPNAVRVPGGAAQNSARFMSYLSELFQDTNKKTVKVAYTGAVGDDELATFLRESLKEANVETLYQVVQGAKTGSCVACCYSEDEATTRTMHATCSPSGRSLTVCLDAACQFDDSKLLDEDIERFSMFYAEGFFISTSFDTLMRVAKHAQLEGKPFILNLSSQFLIQYEYEKLIQLLPYATILFGNETEYKKFWEILEEKKGLDLATPAKGWTYESFAKALGDVATVSLTSQRTVIVTQGVEPAIGYHQGKISLHPISTLKNQKLFKDTNSAGDSFVAGFLSAFAAKKSFKESMERAAYAAGVIVQMTGCTLPSREELKTVSENLNLPAKLAKEVSSIITPFADAA